MRLGLIFPFDWESKMKYPFRVALGVMHISQWPYVSRRLDICRFLDKCKADLFLRYALKGWFLRQVLEDWFLRRGLEDWLLRRIVS